MLLTELLFRHLASYRDPIRFTGDLCQSSTLSRCGIETRALSAWHE